MPDPAPFDALLIVAFGGPESSEDVVPFLENVLRGRNVPRSRLLEVAEHYQRFGGKSPLNDQVRDLIDRLRTELDSHSIDLPIYWGNRNWHPLLTDVVPQMRRDGVGSALAVVLSSFSSYSGCRQYRENIERAREVAGAGAPPVAKLRVWYNHPEFIAANAECLRAALDQLPAKERQSARVAYTAHSIPLRMASGCDYERQLEESSRLVSEAVGVGTDRWRVVFQSRSGRPEDPWLEPDINDHLEELASEGAGAVVVVPIGFLSDHMEVIYDLDTEARRTAERLAMRMVRAETIGLRKRFVSMLRELIAERLVDEGGVRAAVGRFPASGDICPADCCSSGRD